MKIFKYLLFVLGLLLLVLNVAGIFMSLRNNDLTSEITPYKHDISISFTEARKQWNRHANEQERVFAIRASLLINHTMAHYWKDEGIRKYHMLIPPWENYILRLKQVISGDRKYEFRNYKKAIERGVGICSQPCIALKYLLNDNGIKADLWDLKGHVVVQATFGDGSCCMLDPDYGKYVPYSMNDIEANPELVRESYRDQDSVYAAGLISHKHTADIVNLYEKDGNHIYYMDKSFEDFSYLAKWLLPILLVLPFTISLIKKQQR